MVSPEQSLLIEKIKQLKKEKNVTLLAHYYMPPAIQLLEKDGGIADFTGDSLGLSLFARDAKAERILFCGVRFMAETAALLNPNAPIFMAAPEAGCSLASSITAEDVRQLKAQHPGVPVMGYINTYAETKCELDICCTSRNALEIARSIPGNKIIFVPDYYMGQNLAEVIKRETGKELILWKGTCEVHEQFKNEMFSSEPDADILLHWEVPNQLVKEQLDARKGVLGSTNDILSYVKKSKSEKFLLASECDLAFTLKAANPDKEFLTPCVHCKYMKETTLPGIVNALNAIGSLDEEAFLIELDEATRKRAIKPVERMLEFV